MRWLFAKVIRPWQPTLIGLAIVLFVLRNEAAQIVALVGWLPVPDRETWSADHGLVQHTIEERRFRFLRIAEWEFARQEPQQCPHITKSRYGFFEVTDTKWQFTRWNWN